ncbi:putative signal peptide protein [Puccinia sorghi]|uniref:Putative signal peptide protein n=1 Tax=Puccinia sorghi TaxID=27349 RepID=A0A0L6VJJ6_9BASI|nr:putative signal peptide protein [Puccinia sorghi]
MFLSTVILSLCFWRVTLGYFLYTHQLLLEPLPSSSSHTYRLDTNKIQYTSNLTHGNTSAILVYWVNWLFTSQKVEGEWQLHSVAFAIKHSMFFQFYLKLDKHFGVPFVKSQEASVVTKTILPNLFKKPLMHSHCEYCTVIVPKHLHMQKCGVWMAAWLENSACQPQAATELNQFSSLISLVIRICLREKKHSLTIIKLVSGKTSSHKCSNSIILHKFRLIFGELAPKFTLFHVVRLSKPPARQNKPLAMMESQCFDSVLTFVMRAVSLPCHHKIRLYVMVTRSELALADLKTGLGESGSGSVSSSEEKKNRIGLQRIFEMHLPGTQTKVLLCFQLSHWTNIMNCTVKLVEIQASELNQVNIWCATKFSFFGSLLMLNGFLWMSFFTQGFYPHSQTDMSNDKIRNQSIIEKFISSLIGPERLLVNNKLVLKRVHNQVEVPMNIINWEMKVRWIFEGFYYLRNIMYVNITSVVAQLPNSIVFNLNFLTSSHNQTKTTHIFQEYRVKSMLIHLLTQLVIPFFSPPWLVLKPHLNHMILLYLFLPLFFLCGCIKSKQNRSTLTEARFSHIFSRPIFSEISAIDAFPHYRIFRIIKNLFLLFFRLVLWSRLRV